MYMCIYTYIHTMYIPIHTCIIYRYTHLHYIRVIIVEEAIVYYVCQCLNSITNSFK